MEGMARYWAQTRFLAKKGHRIKFCVNFCPRTPKFSFLRPCVVEREVGEVGEVGDFGGVVVRPPE